MRAGRLPYSSPEIVRAGDAHDLTLGMTTPVVDTPGEPVAGFFDASEPPRPDPKPQPQPPSE